LNLRSLTLKYLGWCPVVKSAANFIPSGKFPSDKLISYVGSFMILSLAVYYIVAPPPSYARDLGFKDAEYDSIHDMYVEETAVHLAGYNLLEIWVDAPENTTVRIIMYQVGNANYPRAIWTYRNGVFSYAGQPIGARIEGEWELNGHYIWRVYADSEDTVFHLRTDFTGYNPEFPHASGW